MFYEVKCPHCSGLAEWRGCASCGDDMGILVCRKCGFTMPGISLSSLHTGTDSGEQKADENQDVEGDTCRR